jgi:hypothetical protein
VEQALNDALNAAAAKTNPRQSGLHAILAFALANGTGAASRILPERPEGAGVFQYQRLPFSLADLIAYTLNPAIPGEALYPNSVRRNVWRAQSPILTEWKHLAQSPLPPQATLYTRGTEFEEITPDETSGSYYAYDLERLFALMPLPGGNGAALFMISMQTKPSRIGLKGAILGKDPNWNYIYTGAKGSTLPMVGWAETHIYSAATVSIWVDAAGGLTVYTFKWLKAGWSGLNMVNTSHISTGISRYLSGLTQVLGSDRRPAVAAIAARVKELQAMSDDELAAALAPYSEKLARLAKAQRLDGADFAKALQNGGYARRMSRENRIAELLKSYIKDQLGMTTPEPKS